MFFPVAGVLDKMPAETWEAYAPLFREHSTAAVSARTAGGAGAGRGGRQSAGAHLLALEFLLESAVGLQARLERRRHVPDDRSRRSPMRARPASTITSSSTDCWFTGLYTPRAARATPSSSPRCPWTARARRFSARYPHAKVNAQQMQDLAALIHLCGAGVAQGLRAQRLPSAAGQRCGDHSAAQYLASVNTMMRQFRRLAAKE